MAKKVITFTIAVIIAVASFIGGTKVNTEHHLNMNTVIGFEVTEGGILLHTNDGNGYYLEK